MIGIIDSGMGGLTTLATLVRHRCDNAFCYYADTASAPYGNKDKGSIIRATAQAAKELSKRGADRIVLACNTATVAALPYLQNTLSCPISGVTPPVEEAIQAGGSVLVMATAFTGEYIRKQYRDVRTVTMPALATLVDRWYPDNRQVIQGYLEEKLAHLSNVDNVVLGCTHYILLKEEICRLIRAKRAFDANDALAVQLQKRPCTRGVAIDIVASGAIDESRYTNVLQHLLD